MCAAGCCKPAPRTRTNAAKRRTLLTAEISHKNPSHSNKTASPRRKISQCHVDRSSVPFRAGDNPLIESENRSSWPTNLTQLLICLYKSAKTAPSLRHEVRTMLRDWQVSPNRQNIVILTVSASYWYVVAEGSLPWYVDFMAMRIGGFLVDFGGFWWVLMGEFKHGTERALRFQHKILFMCPQMKRVRCVRPRFQVIANSARRVRIPGGMSDERRKICPQGRTPRDYSSRGTEILRGFPCSGHRVHRLWIKHARERGRPSRAPGRTLW